MQFFGSRRKTGEGVDPADNHPEHQSELSFISSSKQSLGFETVLGPGSQTNGKLRSEGNIRLDGVFTGMLDILGNVLIGENAKIEADVEARNISIAGEVRGNVTGNRVQILNTGRVIGDISARTLTTEEGAYIEGKITMSAPEQPETATPEPVDEIPAEPDSEPEDETDLEEPAETEDKATDD